MMLDSCKKDFVALISRIKMFKEIETTDAKHRFVQCRLQFDLFS